MEELSFYDCFKFPPWLRMSIGITVRQPGGKCPNDFVWDEKFVLCINIVGRCRIVVMSRS